MVEQSLPHVACRIRGKTSPSATASPCSRNWRCFRPSGCTSRLRKTPPSGDFHGREHCPQLLPAPRVRAAAREGKP